MELIPVVVKRSAQGERSYDLFSFLLKNRIIFLNGQINDSTSAIVCAQLIFLEAESPTQDIHVYINSPGGSVDATMAIYDTMHFVKPDIQTWGMGLAASAGSLLLTAGHPGKRNILPHTRVMLHEPSGGYSGRSKHMEDHAKAIKDSRNNLIEIYAKHTNQKQETIEKWLDRETFFNAKEAVKLGLVDKIVTKREEDSKLSTDII